MACRALGLVLCVVIASACGRADTVVHLRVVAEPSWALDELELQTLDGTTRMLFDDEVRLVVPDARAGTELQIDGWGVRGGETWASGTTTVVPIAHDEVDAVLVLTRVACSTCTPGATRCLGNAVETCEAGDGRRCPEWGTAVGCPAQTPNCSLGECGTGCIDECATGDRRCDGPDAVQQCGQADTDVCRDWTPATECAGTMTCSNGTCVETCTDDCTAGTVTCMGTGTSTCGDLDGNGCTEWGPITPCPDGETCSNGSCAPTCTDECTDATCTGMTYRQCGQFDLDPCKDLSAGDSCVPGDACLVGACGATGCTTTALVCDDPPEATCVTGGVLRTYSPSGTCSGGDCTYASMDVACPNCPTCDACANVTCTTPPSVCFGSPGSCADGACTYPFANGATCDDDDSCTGPDTCTNGVCAGPAIPCTTPPASTCLDPSTLRTFASPGTCGGGSCTYVPVDSTCALGCDQGACRGRSADIVRLDTGPSPDALTVAQSSGSSFASWVTWLSGTSDGLQHFIGDVNGDGRDDMTRIEVVASPDELQVALSTGSSFSGWSTWLSGTADGLKHMIGDVNGDGRDDMIRIEVVASPDELQVALSTGSGFQPWATWLSGTASGLQHFVGDVNGDGRADIIRIEVVASPDELQVALSTGSGFSGWTTWLSGTFDGLTHHVGDFNGDGRADMLRLDNLPSPDELVVALSTGSAFSGWSTWLSGTFVGLTHLVGDVDGDGDSDVVRLDGSPSPDEIVVARSTGSSFVTWQTWLSGTFVGLKHFVGNVDGR